jgi:holo-[acyl-carrier protein] synthase
MDIVGVGAAIVECLRIRRMIERHGEEFLLRVYTGREIRACQLSKHSTERFAERWAAKEAILKCLGTNAQGLHWTDVEIRPDPAGQPKVLMCGAAKDLAQRLRVSDILVSMGHCRAYATAHSMAVRNGAARAGTGEG